MFLILKTIYFFGYTDNNILFVVRDNITDVMKALEEIGDNFVNWFLNNSANLLQQPKINGFINLPPHA